MNKKIKITIANFFLGYLMPIEVALIFRNQVSVGNPILYLFTVFIRTTFIYLVLTAIIYLMIYAFGKIKYKDRLKTAAFFASFEGLIMFILFNIVHFLT